MTAAAPLPYIVRQPRSMAGSATWIVVGRYSRKQAGTVTRQYAEVNGWAAAVGGTWLGCPRSRTAAAALVWDHRPEDVRDVAIVVTRYGRTVSPSNPGGPGRRETWAAETVGREWQFEREDSPGTPWLIWHRPSVDDGSYTIPVAIAGSLAQCGALAASGGLVAQLARDKQAAAERTATR